jgi:hypothetical protein
MNMMNHDKRSVFTLATTVLIIAAIAVSCGILPSGNGDEAGITVEPSVGLTTSEGGGSSEFTVVLDSVPSASVTIYLHSADASEGSISPNVLTFDEMDWDFTQSVTVTGVDDSLVDGDVEYTIVTDAAESDDPNYDELDAADVVVTNTDDDTTGFVLDPSDGVITTEMGGSRTFSVALVSEPTHDVTVSLSSDDSGEGSPTVDSLVFTATNWSDPQTVTVSGVDDDLIDGPTDYAIIVGPATSDDAAFDGMASVEVDSINIDNDLPISAGNRFTHTIDPDGTLWGWGLSMRLGIGETYNRIFPVRVGAEADWQMLSSGSDFCIGMKTDGTLWAWGANGDGELGDGTYVGQTVPTALDAGNDWAFLEAGHEHVMAIKNDGTLWAWGANGSGRSGLGSAIYNQTTPAQVGEDRAHAKIRLHFRRSDCVVPVRKCSMSREFNLCHLVVRNFHTFFIVFPHKISLHFQAGFSFCCANKFQHCLIGI